MPFALNQRLFAPMAVAAKTDLIIHKIIPGHQDQILIFHGITSQNDSRIKNRHMPARQFATLIHSLAKRYAFVPLKEITDTCVTRHKEHRRRLAITFDDGYQNLLEDAIPLLEKLNIPATIFALAAPLMEENWICWADAIELLLAHNCKDSLQWNSKTISRPREKNEARLQKEYILQHFLTMGTQRAAAVRVFLEANDWNNLHLRSDHRDWKFLNAQELQRLSRNSLFEIGCHGFAHGNLTAMDLPNLCEELNTAKQILESTIQKPVSTFAFPNGDCNEQAILAANIAGYKSLFVGHVNPVRSPCSYIFKRFCISNTVNPETNLLRVTLNFTKILGENIQ